MTETGFRHAFLVLLVLGISALFFAMVRSFVLTVVLAALFSGVAYPVYRRVVRLFDGRARLAAAATQAGFFNQVSPIWIGISVLVAVGMGIMMAVSSGKPAMTESTPK